MERKGLRVNMKKIKIMVSGPGLDLLRDSEVFRCAVCRSVGHNYKYVSVTLMPPPGASAREKKSSYETGHT